MSQKQIIGIICVVSGLFVTNHSHCSRDFSVSASTELKVASAIGITAAAGYGLYRLWEWVFSPSDEKLLEEANNTYRDVYAHYNKMFELLKNSYHGLRINNDIIYNFSEAVLYQLGVEKHYDAFSTSIDAYLRQLYKAIKDLRYYHQKLNKKIQDLCTIVHTENSVAWLHDQMRIMSKKITEFIPNLTLLHDYLKHHKGYYALFELESSLLYRYSQELNILTSYTTDNHYVSDLIHRCIMMHHNQHRSCYPYIAYVDRIGKDVEVLYNAIRNLAYNYSERVCCAQDLYNKLSSIKSVAASSFEYHKELLEKERAQLKERELAIQQRQLHAMQQQNQLREQELRLQEQRFYDQQYRI